MKERVLHTSADGKHSLIQTASEFIHKCGDKRTSLGSNSTAGAAKYKDIVRHATGMQPNFKVYPMKESTLLEDVRKIVFGKVNEVKHTHIVHLVKNQHGSWGSTEIGSKTVKIHVPGDDKLGVEYHASQAASKAGYKRLRNGDSVSHSVSKIEKIGESVNESSELLHDKHIKLGEYHINTTKLHKDEGLPWKEHYAASKAHYAAATAHDLRHPSANDLSKKAYDLTSVAHNLAKKGYGIKESTQIDELSKKTLGSYIRKAHADSVTKSNHRAQDVADRRDYGYKSGNTSRYDKRIATADRKLDNREVGTRRAVKKLTTESLEIEHYHDIANSNKFKHRSSGNGITEFHKGNPGPRFEKLVITNGSWEHHKKGKVIGKGDDAKSLSNHFTKNESVIDRYLAKLQEGRGRPRKDGSKPDEEDSADGHILMQLRKVVSLRGQKPVKFGNGEVYGIHPSHAYKAMDKYSKLKKADDKESFVKKLGHSRGSFFQAMQEEYEMITEAPKWSNMYLSDFKNHAKEEGHTITRSNPHGRGNGNLYTSTDNNSNIHGKFDDFTQSGYYHGRDGRNKSLNRKKL